MLTLCPLRRLLGSLQRLQAERVLGGGGVSRPGLHPLLHTASNSGQRLAAIGPDPPLSEKTSAQPPPPHHLSLSFWAF